MAMEMVVQTTYMRRAYSVLVWGGGLQFPPVVPFFMVGLIKLRRFARHYLCGALQTISSVGPFFYGLFVGLPALIFDVWIRPPLLIINHSICLIVCGGGFWPF